MKAREAAGNQSQLRASLNQSIEQISGLQEVQFQEYQKRYIEEDGYVFWVATGKKQTVKGSLHYGTERHQDEDQTIGANQVLLTSETEITKFNQIAPNMMWIASWPIGTGSPPLRVAFSARGMFYQQADIWHYSGFAVYPALESQIIQTAEDLPEGPIVSNSLPIWLAYNQFAKVYPSYLVPDNIRPPYIVAHVDPAQTEALGAFPVLSPLTFPLPDADPPDPLQQLSESQLTRDVVTLTLYGFNNQRALAYFQYLIQASINDATFGFGNSPIVQDEKRVQVEIAALAQKKTITILANYYQSAADVLAVRVLLDAEFSYLYVEGGVGNYGQGQSSQDEQTTSGEGGVTE